MTTVHDKKYKRCNETNVHVSCAKRFDSCSFSRGHHQAEYEKEHVKKMHAHLIFMVIENFAPCTQEV